MIYVDPPRAMFPFPIPFLNRPILWYGVLFALGVFLGYLVFVQQLKKNKEIRGQATQIAEALFFYVIIGVIVGARLFELLFYQHIRYLIDDPLSFFKVWEGGLSSHGGVTGALVALFFFLKKYRKKYQFLSGRSLLDGMAVSAGIVAFFIRLGNFMNQEILGTVTNVPWAFVFLHPLDGSSLEPRHPVQLYEAAFYLMIFFLFYFVISKKEWKEGKKAGLFLMIIFTFRFGIEFFKQKQSVLLPFFSLDMGQELSIPLIIWGAYLFFAKRRVFL